jgi:ATP-dependent helicase/nuclease subunit A
MPELKKPAFMAEDNEASKAYIGTIMHHCMQKIELTTDINRDTIKAEAARFVSEGIISEKDIALVDISAIEGFFKSFVGESMRKAKKVFREVPFEMFVEADEIFDCDNCDEKIVVQGMIDAYFEDEEGNLILVDYKTDRKGGRNDDEFVSIIASRYKLQMDYYAKALRLLTGKNVYKKYIYLFDTGKVAEIE